MVFLVAGAGLWIFKDFFKIRKNQQKPLVQQDLAVSNQVTATEIDKDSDNDGLKDWEELLWKTDINNPDTDGDGTPDGEEIKQDRNPLVASKSGKNDKLETEKTKVESSPAEYPTTLTEAIGQQFFSNYLFLRESSGGSVSAEDKETLIASFLSSINTLGTGPKEIYTKSDIKIDSAETKDSIKDYGNNLAFVIKKYFDPISESEMAVLKKYLDSKDKADLKELEKISNAYSNTAKEMVSLTTPQSFSESHLNLINYFINISKEISKMGTTYEDPVQAVSAIKQYQEDSTAAYQIFRSLNDYFLSKGAVFESNEPAEFFKNYLL